MAIQQAGVGLGAAETYKPQDFIRAQQDREDHYLISLIMHQDWRHQTNRKLSKTVFPQCRLTLISNIRFPTRNTFREMTSAATEPEIIMYEKSAYDQIDELVKACQVYGIFHLTSLRGVSPNSALIIENNILPTSTNEEDYTYPCLLKFFKEDAVKNILALDNEGMENVADKARLELLDHLAMAYQYANKHVADANNEIGKSKIAQGGKFAYDIVDIAMMKFLGIKAKFEVSPESGVQQQSKADVHIISQQVNESSALEMAALRQELTVIRIEQAKNLQLAQQAAKQAEREMKRCKACAADVYKEAIICPTCKLPADKKPTV